MLIEEFSEGRKIAVISDITRAELSKAPRKVGQVMEKIPEEFIEEVSLTEESNELSMAYLKEKVISKRYLADSQHIAIATVVKADIIISWNFKHIVNIERIRGYNSVNIKKGYGTVEIRSPWEVVGYE
ncbi:MAG: PIN domain protein [Thermoplasmatota archaeon]